MVKFLLWSGLIIYVVNYAIGWLLYFKIITMKKQTHQIFYTAILLNLFLLLFYLKFLSGDFLLNSASLAAMIVLPLGQKGGVYHRIVSSVGLGLYLVFVCSF
jgi:hypothetical protein